MDIVSSAPMAFNSFWEGSGQDVTTPPEEVPSRWYVCFRAGEAPEGFGEELENPADPERLAVLTYGEYSQPGVAAAAGDREILSLMRVL